MCDRKYPYLIIIIIFVSVRVNNMYIRVCYNYIHIIQHSTYRTLYNSGVTPILDYCSAIRGYQNFGYIDTVQNRAIRFYLGVHKFAPNLAINGIWAE